MSENETKPESGASIEVEPPEHNGSVSMSCYEAYKMTVRRPKHVTMSTATHQSGNIDTVSIDLTRKQAQDLYRGLRRHFENLEG